MLTITSYNVNGIRSAVSKGLWQWLREDQSDIVCLQETKARTEDVNMLDLEALGYCHHWHSADQKGYSGVLTLSKRAPDNVIVGCGMPIIDCEGRILRTDFGDWTLLNCYFPSGTMGEIRQGFKMQFLDDFSRWINELRRERPQLIVVGDYNIAHREIDIHNPRGNRYTTGFLPEERAWFDQWLAGGFTDAFRFKNPDLVEYSWWSYRAGVRASNKGWRIDYQCVTDNLRDRIVRAHHLTNVVHSDHCPMQLIIDL